MSGWRLCDELREPAFTLGVGVRIRRDVVSIVLLFWVLTWIRQRAARCPHPGVFRGEKCGKCGEDVR